MSTAKALHEKSSFTATWTEHINKQTQLAEIFFLSFLIMEHHIETTRDVNGKKALNEKSSFTTTWTCQQTNPTCRNIFSAF